MLGSTAPSASCGRQARPGTPKQQLQLLRCLRTPRRRPDAPRVAAAPGGDSGTNVYAVLAALAEDVAISNAGTSVDELRTATMAEEHVGTQAEDLYAEARAAWEALAAEEAAHGVGGISPATFDRCKVAQQRLRAHELASKQAQLQAQLAAPPQPRAPAHAPPPSLANAVQWADARFAPALQALPGLRTATARMWAAAAAIFAGLAAGHVVLAEAAEEAAAEAPLKQSTGTRREAIGWRASAALAWRLAYEALEQAQRNDPTGPAVREATDVANSMVDRVRERRKSARC